MNTPLGTLGWYWITTILLAVLLFFPITKFVWVVRVRRFERKEGRTATEAEREKLKKSARFISAAIAVTFAFLYNKAILKQ